MRAAAAAVELNCCALAAAAALMLALMFASAAAASGQEETEELVDAEEAEFKRLLDGGDAGRELSSDEVSGMLTKYGNQIGGLIDENVDQLIRELESGKHRMSREELDRFERSTKSLVQDTAARISATGKAGTGEMGEFSLADAYSSGKDFLVNKVNQRLQHAGSYIGSQMSSLARMAPKLKNKARQLPGKLRKILRWPTFLNYKVKFNKVYKSLSSELYRQMVFLRTQTVAGIHNLKFFFGRTRHLLMTTEFADITEKEYGLTYGNHHAGEPQTEEPAIGAEQLEGLRRLRAQGVNRMGMKMDDLLVKSRESSPALRLAAKHKREREELRKQRRKRDINELDDDDEEGPMFMPAGGDFMDIDGGDGGSGSDAGDSDSTGADLGGSEEAEAVDEFVTGFQRQDLEARMDAELDDELDDDETEAGDDDPMEIDSGNEQREQELKPIDWSQHDCMPIIENQDSCGFCYALVATSLAGFYNCLELKKSDPAGQPRRLNARFTSDCGRYLTEPDQPQKIFGCKGGILSQAVRFIGNAGAYAFFPYEIARVKNIDKRNRVAESSLFGDACAFERPASIMDWAPIQVPFFKRVYVYALAADDWETVDLMLETVGPVMINVRTWIGFKDYGPGVFDDTKAETNEKAAIHSMMIVGRDRDAATGQIYYKLRNSHGIVWGERGYMRITRRILEKFTQAKMVLWSVDENEQA